MFILKTLRFSSYLVIRSSSVNALALNVSSLLIFNASVNSNCLLSTYSALNLRSFSCTLLIVLKSFTLNLLNTLYYLLFTSNKLYNCQYSSLVLAVSNSRQDLAFLTIEADMLGEVGAGYLIVGSYRFLYNKQIADFCTLAG